MKIAHSLVFACVALAATGCAERDKVAYEATQIRGEAQQSLDQIRSYQSEQSTLVVDDRKPWFGNQAVPFSKGLPLPDSVSRDNSVVITFERPLTMEEVASRIYSASNIRVVAKRDRSDDQASSATDVGGQGFLPADGMEVSGGRMIWQGNLSTLLDQVADHFDAVWEFDGAAVTLTTDMTRTFMLHSLAGEIQVDGSVKAENTDNGSLPEQTVETETKLSVWEEIEKTVDGIVNKHGRANYSPATGTITVSGPPSVVKKVEDYLRIQNELRLRRVAVETRVLSVSLDKRYNTNFDFDAVISEALLGQPFAFSSIDAGNTGRTVSAGLLRGFPTGTGNSTSVQAVVNALSAFAEDISVEHSGSVVTMSDLPAPLQVATKRSYVARVTGSSTDGSSSVSLEPGTIDIGLTMNVLPRVIDKTRVMMRVGLGITDLVELREFSSGQSSIQLPEIDTTGFLQNVVLNSGDTLVLAGFEKKNANDADVGTGVPWFKMLGGRNTYSMGREIRVLLITATILPTEPVEIVSR